MPEPPSEWTVLSMLDWATSYFEEKGIRNPRFSIEWLLAHILSIRRLDLYLKYDRPLSEEELSELRPLVKRRAGHEPLQYITGQTDFYNTKIHVKPGVLIPRMETEQLVEIILERHGHEPALNIIDIGTGSGCIPIALKKERSGWNVHATDISEDALRIAKLNAQQNDTDIHFELDDVFLPSHSLHQLPYDLIISNPPYILLEEKSQLDFEVKEFEPEIALFCNSTEDIYNAILEFCEVHLSEKGFVFLELHENHAIDVKQIFDSRNWSSEIKKDYDKKDRFLVAKKF